MKVSTIFVIVSLILLVYIMCCHLQSHRISAFIPEPARVYGCRVFELKEHGISEDDAMSVANVRIFLLQSMISLQIANTACC